jgi:DNA polymerase alpha subunit A
VLEPKKGLYDHYVLLLDFNSLYPSIVQEYNLCFTTVERVAPLPDGTIPPPTLPEQGTEPGVLPRLIKSIVERRREVKRLLKSEKDPARQQQLDTRQKALKIMANSMYGCLGFHGSRFFARPIAELICTTGRATLQRTVDVAEGQVRAGCDRTSGGGARARAQGRAGRG